MSSLILPRRFQAQPQGPVEIDWSNPLTSGLFDAWTAQTLAYQSALGRKPISSGAVGYTTGKFGIGVFATSASIRYERSALNLTLPHSCVALATVPANAQASYVRINNIFIPLQKWDADTRAAGADPWSIPVYGTAAETAAFCAIRENNNSVAVYKNGAYVARTSSSSSYGTSAHPLCFLGTETNGELVNSSAGCLYSAALWSRALQLDEIAELAYNPWQIFKPRKSVLYFGGGAPTNYPSAANSGSITLTGSAANGVRALAGVAASGSITLTGSAANAVRALAGVAASGSITLTGSNAAALHTWLGVAGAGSITLTGSDAAGVKAGSGAYTSAADAGSITLSGSAAVGTYDRLAAAGAGSITITGSDASGIRNIPATAEAGSIVLTGSAAVGIRTWLAVAEAGSITLSGSDAEGVYGGAMTLTPADLDAIAAAVWADPAAVAAHAKLDEIIARITC